MKTNTIILIGRLGKEPRVTQMETATVANFSLAVNETFSTKKGETQTRTTWFNIAIWGEQATKVAEFPKGALLKLTGRIQEVVKTKTVGKGEVEYKTYEVVGHDISLYEQ